jgi:DNA-binding transcriptional ArsR family regulator
VAYDGTSTGETSGETSGDENVTDVFLALADPTRRRVVELLGGGSYRAGELAREVGTSAPVMSRHLRILLQAGLVADERVPHDARARVFRLRPDQITVVQAWLDQVQAHWEEQLGSFQRHVQQRHEQRHMRRRPVERRATTDVPKRKRT